MKRFDDLYHELLKATLENREEEYIETLDQIDTYQLDCLLHPKNIPLYGLPMNVTVRMKADIV